ncbi:MAG: xylulokinase [Pseudomonadota bacterium]
MYIGLDLGTSGLKAVLVDDNQAIIGEAHAPLTNERPHPGWSEQDASSWLSAADDVLQRLSQSYDLASVKAIGLSGQMHGATLLDASGKALRPCILWNDTRSAEQAALMDDDPQWREKSGNIVFPGFTAPKLAWVRENEPDVFTKTAKVLLPKDFLRLWLTGEYVSDMSDSAGTSWLDTGKRDWDDALLAATGLQRTHMPDLVEGSTPSGSLRAKLANRFGMSANVIVAGGGGDNAASAVGVGVAKPGSAFVSLGTSGVLFASCAAYTPDAETAVHTFCHALPDTWHQMGVILSATDSLEWYARLTGATAAEITAPLTDLRAPGRAMFLPYLGGERTPHNDANIRGALTGIEHVADRTVVAQAVMEGVVFAFRDCFDALAKTGTEITELLAVGGGSRSDYWLKAIATSLNVPVERPVAGDFGGAFGAARLGMLAVHGVSDDLLSQPKVDAVFEPDASLVEPFAEAQIRYRDSYSALRGLS